MKKKSKTCEWERFTTYGFKLFRTSCGDMVRVVYKKCPLCGRKIKIKGE